MDDDAKIEAAAEAIHAAPGACPLCAIGLIPSKPSWRELFEESRERHRGAARLVERAIHETIERCAQEVDSAGSADPEVRDIAAAIRKLGES